MKTFLCRMCSRDLLDGEGPTTFVDAAYVCIDENQVLRVFDSQDLNQWIFALNLIPEQPLFTIDLQNAVCSVDFRRVVSANRNHLRGRMRITSDFGSGLERLIFKFSIEDYNRIQSVFRSFES